jgi:hypothetical protein
VAQVRHLLKIIREPGAHTVMTIDGEPVKIVRAKFRESLGYSEVLYEDGEPDEPGDRP